VRHGKAGFKLGRVTAHRWALFRNLLVALFRHERIMTTEAKAKAIRGLADHGHPRQARRPHARRQVLLVPDTVVVKKLFDTIAARFSERHGGYTRIMKAGLRPGDRAQMVVLELVDRPEAPREKGKKDAKAEKAPKEDKKAGKGEASAGAAKGRRKKAAAASNQAREKNVRGPIGPRAVLLCYFRCILKRSSAAPASSAAGCCDVSRSSLKSVVTPDDVDLDALPAFLMAASTSQAVCGVTGRPSLRARPPDRSACCGQATFGWIVEVHHRSALALVHPAKGAAGRPCRSPPRQRSRCRPGAAHRDPISPLVLSAMKRGGVRLVPIWPW
jgi:large subunit ribosomal protein L17